MPTGYTYPVAEGELTEFNEFAMECARAFGALVTIRDEQNTPIPQEFKPSVFYAERLEQARTRLAELQAMTPEQAEDAALAAYDKAIGSAREYEARIETENARLNAMARKVREWQPPTADHAGLKEFMLEQLRISLHGPSYKSPEPERLSGQKWLQQEIQLAHDEIGRYAGENEKEGTYILDSLADLG